MGGGGGGGQEVPVPVPVPVEEANTTRHCQFSFAFITSVDRRLCRLNPLHVPTTLLGSSNAQPFFMTPLDSCACTLKETVPVTRLELIEPFHGVQLLIKTCELLLVGYAGCRHPSYSTWGEDLTLKIIREDVSTFTK